MKKLIFMAAVAAVAAVCLADEAKPEKMTRKAKSELFRMKKTGGKIKRPGIQKGAVAFVNAAGDKVDAKVLADLAGRLGAKLQVEVKVVSAPELPRKGLAGEIARHGANAAVFLKWNEECDVPMIYAPDQRWAVVNVCALKAGVDGDKYKKRLINELARAFAYVCGSGAEMGADGLMAASSLAAVDAATPELTFDVQARIGSYLPTIGVVPYQETTYLVACREGWAPAPSNDYQKAVWDKMHELPTNPITIEPEKKPVAK